MRLFVPGWLFSLTYTRLYIRIYMVSSLDSFVPVPASHVYKYKLTASSCATHSAPTLLHPPPGAWFSLLDSPLIRSHIVMWGDQDQNELLSSPYLSRCVVFLSSTLRFRVPGVSRCDQETLWRVCLGIVPVSLRSSDGSGGPCAASGRSDHQTVHFILGICCLTFRPKIQQRRSWVVTR